MAQNSSIEWVSSISPDGKLIKGHTANIWWGCNPVHRGCDHCYANAIDKRVGEGVWGQNRRIIPSFVKNNTFDNLVEWQEKAAKKSEIHKIFCGSMNDFYEKPMPLYDKTVRIGTTADLRNKLLNQIDRGLYPNLLFMFLTKRPSNINKMNPKSWLRGSPKNTMFGTSVSEMKNYKLIEQLMEVEGYLFLSLEPLLGRISIKKYLAQRKFAQIIVGGESGKKARNCKLEWIEQIIEECQEHDTPVFVKQLGTVLGNELGINHNKDFDLFPESVRIREFPKL